MKIIYEAPTIEVVEIISEGVLCSSPGDTDMDPDYGNM